VLGALWLYLRRRRTGGGAGEPAADATR
jgi:hypothetical protein